MNKLKQLTKMKKRIASGGKGFHTHQYIDNSGYVDFYFIGTYKGEEVIWNATLSTMRGEYYQKVHDMARDEAEGKFPYPEGAEVFTFEKIEGRNCSRLINNYPEITDKCMVYVAKRMMELLDSGEVFIERQRVEIDEDYEYGVGLHAYIDAVPGLNEEDVLKFIEDFNAHGVFMYDDCNDPPVTLTSEQLGVVLHKNKFVVWKDGFSHDTVAVNLDAMGDE